MAATFSKGYNRESPIPPEIEGEEVMSTTTSWISKKLDRCGGDACVRDTRITVWGLVRDRQLRATDAEILQAIQGLTPADLQTAWEYAEANMDEIERAIRENEEGEEGLVE